MKKLILVVVTAIITISTISALEINSKQIYQPGETLIISLPDSDFIEPLTREKIFFYSGRGSRIQIPMLYDLAKISDKYYIYALLPDKERNYTLLIKDTYFYQEGKEKRQDIKINFSVQGNSVFSVYPGFIITKKEFSIWIENKGKETEEISLKLNNQEISAELSSGEKKQLSFSIQEFKNFTITTLEISGNEITYKIPVMIFPNLTEPSVETENISRNISIEPSERRLRFTLSDLKLNVLTDSNWLFKIFLSNMGNENIENIQLSSDLDMISLSPQEIENLEPKAMTEINLSVRAQEKGIYKGVINANHGNLSAILPVTLITEENQSELNISLNPIESEKSCKEVKGQVCKNNETCKGAISTLISGACCIGSCIPKKTEKDSDWNIISIIIIALVLLAIAFFIYKKSRKKPKKFSDVLKEKEKTYKERLKSQPPGK